MMSLKSKSMMIESRLIDLLRFGCRAPYGTKFPGNVPRSEEEGKNSTTEFERSFGCKRRLSSSWSTPGPSSTEVDDGLAGFSAASAANPHTTTTTTHA
jgi:hypothetical protein